MAEERISSVLVGGEAGPGIVTERDILRALAAGGEGALDRTADEVRVAPAPHRVRAEDFVLSRDRAHGATQGPPSRRQSMPATLSAH